MRKHRSLTRHVKQTSRGASYSSLSGEGCRGCTEALHMQLFLGTLREAEVERVNQRISQAIIETCLAMTIFRDEFNVKFVALFTVLSFIKVFHWLVQDRCALYCSSSIRHGCM